MIKIFGVSSNDSMPRGKVLVLELVAWFDLLGSRKGGARQHQTFHLVITWLLGVRPVIVLVQWCSWWRLFGGALWRNEDFLWFRGFKVVCGFVWWVRFQRSAVPICGGKYIHGFGTFVRPRCTNRIYVLGIVYLSRHNNSNL